MIRKFLHSMLVPALLLASAGAAAELKIAVLDTQRALLESEEMGNMVRIDTTTTMHPSTRPSIGHEVS